MKTSAVSETTTSSADELEGLELLLKEIEREQTPERLLELARQLQAALNERSARKLELQASALPK